MGLLGGRGLVFFGGREAFTAGFCLIRYFTNRIPPTLLMLEETSPFTILRVGRKRLGASVFLIATEPTLCFRPCGTAAI